MTITYPRELPAEFEIADTEFDLVPVVWQSRSRSGAAVTIEYGNPYWAIRLISQARLRSHHVTTIRAWWDSLQGGLKTFLAYDRRRQYPVTYCTGFAGLTRAGGGSFNGQATITSVPSSTGLTFNTGGANRLPPDFVLKAGDYVSVIKSGSPDKYSLHRIVEDQTASGSGVITALNIWPPLVTSVFSLPLEAQFGQPKGEFVPDPGGLEAVASPSRVQVSLTAKSKVI